MVCAAFLEMNAGNSATISPRTDQVHPSEDAQWLVRNTNRPFKTPRNLISEGPLMADLRQSTYVVQGGCIH